MSHKNQKESKSPPASPMKLKPISPGKTFLSGRDSSKNIIVTYCEDLNLALCDLVDSTKEVSYVGDLPKKQRCSWKRDSLLLQQK